MQLFYVENAFFLSYSCIYHLFSIIFAAELRMSGREEDISPSFFFISQKLFSLVKVKYPKNKKK